MIAAPFTYFCRSVVHCHTRPAVLAVHLMACACLVACAASRPCFGQPASENDPGTPTAKDGEQVLRHAVFFKFKDTSAKEDVDLVVAAFRALPSKIEEIREFQLGENVSKSGLNDELTHCFLLTFKDEEERAAYLPHPEHKAFGAVLRPHLDKVFVIDYWGRPQRARLKKELKHAVFFKFRDDASDDDVRKVEEDLADLPSKIDAIKAFEWGRNNSPEKHDQGFTHCFMFTFDSEDGLKEYVAHPAHKSAADNLRPKMDMIRVLDFWCEDGGPSNER
jgi:hypothetical protein